jgi:hypothetical protein
MPAVDTSTCISRRARGRFGRSSKFFQTSFAFAMQSETILSNATRHKISDCEPGEV